MQFLQWTGLLFATSAVIFIASVGIFVVQGCTLVKFKTPTEAQLKQNFNSKAKRSEQFRRVRRAPSKSETMQGSSEPAKSLIEITSDPRPSDLVATIPPEVLKNYCSSTAWQVWNEWSECTTNCGSCSTQMRCRICVFSTETCSCKG
ncbi:hypothetical protein AB6A40_005052 [Gnathostoma spinigerum]|uniref:PSI domain-containing protein n=1 Tax=Gnathostoma spinigerum TaxID=75299 RepID=A0ABD6EMZ7_9BILA